MKTLTREEIQALSERELDDLLGYYDCPEQVHPVYSGSLNAQFELAEKMDFGFRVDRLCKPDPKTGELLWEHFKSCSEEELSELAIECINDICNEDKI